MRATTIVAERFEIRERAGAGGMGVVYQAWDRRSARLVALKLLHALGDTQRFLQESAVLAELDDPAIVRHVAHGSTDDGRAWLAMEWLDGELLSQRLGRGALSIAETLALGRRLAAGLATAHRLGVVHRDVKPSNVFLVAGAPEQAKLIDFGLARRHLDARMTRTGTIVGTLAFMSPEQAQARRDLDGRSDAFSLGGVIYACVTGQRPFRAEDATALLAKVLLDDPTPIRELVPAAPIGLERLIAALLRKRPSERPSAPEALRAIDEIAEHAEHEPATTATGALSNREQRVVWLVMAGGADDTPTQTADQQIMPHSAAPRELEAIVTAHGGRLHTLANAAVVATFIGAGAVTDAALGAARCALAMRALLPAVPMALSTGFGVIGAHAPVGSAIDRGVEALSRSEPGRIAVDALTAGLIGHQFEIRAGDRGLFLEAGRASADATRKLLGRPTPHVGRERELSQLSAIFETCESEPSAHAVLVTGPAGAGKSRLRYELVARLADRHAPPAILMGRGDPMSAGAPFWLLGDALRRRFGIVEGELPEQRAEQLLGSVATSFAGRDDALRVASFLGELAGIPFSERAAPWIVAARRDRTLMGDAMRAAWLDWLAAETARRAVVLVLEDLHWGDLPTIAFVDAALAELEDRPFMVIALGRPETKDSFPKLWQDRSFDEIRLRPLRRAAREELVRAVLGDDLPSATLERVVELSDGNAFHLEELIRAVAEGRTSLPETVIGMVQSRLDALDRDSRRLLRAGSIFGGRFWKGGAGALSGMLPGSELDGLLADLVARELVSERPSAVLAGEVEYVFRHSLVREVSYSALTDEDRELGHRLAAEWLEQSGEIDALTLAEHLRLGGAAERAVALYRRAAEHALAGNDLGAAIERVETALELAADERDQAELYLLVTHAHFWRGEHDKAMRGAREALRRLPRAGAGWYWALGDLCSSAVRSDRPDVYAWCEAEALSTELALGEDPAAEIRCLSRCIAGAMKDGRRESVAAIVERVDQLVHKLPSLPPLAAAYAHHLRAAAAYYEGDAAAHLRETRAASEAFDRAGDARNACNARLNLGYQLIGFGVLEQAETLLRETLRVGERLGLSTVVAYVEHNLGLVAAQLGQFDEAFSLEMSAAGRAAALEEPVLEGYARMYLAEISLLAHDAARAEREARASIRLLEHTPIHRSAAHAALSAALLAQSRTADALGEARSALELLARVGGPEEHHVRAELAFAEAASAAGELEASREALTSGRARLLARARKIEDPDLARRLLERVPHHARLLELAARLCDSKNRTSEG